jgi:hypothetical protein
MMRERNAHPIMDKSGLIVGLFFAGWLSAEAFYGTGDWERAKKTGYFGAVPAIAQLTDEVGACQIVLDKHGWVAPLAAK